MFNIPHWLMLVLVAAFPIVLFSWLPKRRDDSDTGSGGGYGDESGSSCDGDGGGGDGGGSCD